jgi:Ca2+/H+ antiporter, TMEM165/GDT1 family
MSGLIAALVAVLVAGIGARDQMVMAHLVRSQGPRPALLVAALLVTLATAAVAGWAAGLIAPSLASNARLMLLALAVGFAGVEALFIAPPRNAQEPTRSLAAAAIVLAYHQCTDAARFLIFATGIAVNAPLPAMIGGALGGVILLALACTVPDQLVWARLRVPRRACGIGLLILGAFLIFRAIGRI